MDLKSLLNDLPLWLQVGFYSGEFYTWREWQQNIFPELALAGYSDATVLRFFERSEWTDLPGSHTRSRNERGRFFLYEYHAFKREFFGAMRNH
jgi:hypothetical protein